MKIQILDTRGCDFAHNITHNHAGLHEEIEAFFQDSGITVAYDGMTVEF